MPSKKLIGAVAFTAALGGGGLAGALLGGPSISGAQEGDTTSTTVTVDDGPRFGHGPFDLSVAADAIGISEDDLRTALEGGQTIAQVAEANGVDRQAVIDAMVAAATERIDQAVTDGRIDQARADEDKAELPDRIAALVDGQLPDRPGD
jgi:hypothetical protein